MINGVPHVEMYRPPPVLHPGNANVTYNPPLDPAHHRMLENIHRRQVEKQTEKDYKEIYEYARKAERKKYSRKIEKLKNQLQQTSKALDGKFYI